MIESHITTPFGRRPLSLALLKGQHVAAKKDASLTADKWQIMRMVCAVRPELGIGDRTLTVLNALISFHPETEFRSNDNLVVFPSNEQLSLRAHGMAPATLRRHLSALVEANLVLRRDSPNGKRYARRNRAGEIAYAYGFDLAPLLARSAEFAQLAKQKQERREAIKQWKEQISVLRRDAMKLIEFAQSEGLSPDQIAPVLEQREAIAQLNATLPRHPEEAELREFVLQMDRHVKILHKLLKDKLFVEEMSANEGQIERQIETTKLESHDSIELKPENPTAPRPAHASDQNLNIVLIDEGRKQERPSIQISSQPMTRDQEKGFDLPIGSCTSEAQPGPQGRGGRDFVSIPVEEKDRKDQKKQKTNYPLEMVLRYCPDISAYGVQGVASWRDMAIAVGTVRRMLGINDQTWFEALRVLGERDSAILIASVLQRGTGIENPGGYVRAILRKVEAGRFSIGSLLMSLSGQSGSANGGAA